MAIEITEFEIILSVLFVVGSAFAAWLYVDSIYVSEVVSLSVYGRQTINR